ncbi:1759_t:CDS:1, partial [Funneliformis caledonium]
VAYDTLAQLFNDQFWMTKFFDHHQRTFVLTYERPSNPLKESDPLKEPDPLEEPDPLDESDPLERSDFLQNSTIESQNKKIFNKQKKLVQVVVS